METLTIICALSIAGYLLMPKRKTKQPANSPGCDGCGSSCSSCPLNGQPNQGQNIL